MNNLHDFINNIPWIIVLPIAIAAFLYYKWIVSVNKNGDRKNAILHELIQYAPLEKLFDYFIPQGLRIKNHAALWSTMIITIRNVKTDPDGIALHFFADDNNTALGIFSIKEAIARKFITQNELEKMVRAAVFTYAQTGQW